MTHPNHDWSLHSQRIKDSHSWVGPKRPGHWSLQNIQEKGVPGRPLPDYQQHLYRLLGPEKASQIVNPPILEKPISPLVQRLLVAGIDMGAEELWRALHEEPKCQRQLAEAKKGCSLSHQVPWLGCPVSTPRMQQVAHWRQQLHTMHRLGKQRQRTASYLLATKHITDLSDPYGTEGPTRYLHCIPGNKQGKQEVLGGGGEATKGSTQTSPETGPWTDFFYTSQERRREERSGDSWNVACSADAAQIHIISKRA